MIKGASTARNFLAKETLKRGECLAKDAVLRPGKEDELDTVLIELIRLRSNLIKDIYSNRRNYGLEPESQLCLRFVDQIACAHQAEEKRFKEEAAAEEYTSSYYSS